MDEKNIWGVNRQDRVRIEVVHLGKTSSGNHFPVIAIAGSCDFIINHGFIFVIRYVRKKKTSKTRSSNDVDRKKTIERKDEVMMRKQNMREHSVFLLFYGEDFLLLPIFFPRLALIPCQKEYDIEGSCNACPFR